MMRFGCYYPIQKCLCSHLLYKSIKLRTYKTITLTVVLRVFKNKVLRRVFERKKDKVAGFLRGLQNDELHNFYSFDQVK
jgi:hypothetical protein